MGDAPRAVITAAVEGSIDEAVARVLVNGAGASLGPVHGRQGKPTLQRRIHAYDRAARHSPWLVLIDLDRDAECAPTRRMRWLPAPAPSMELRIAVRAIEAWLLADSEEMARFLGVRRRSIPRDPETLDDPKRFLVELARSSRRRDIRDDLVPREGSGRSVGPAYTARIIEFASSRWRPAEAAGRSSSLRRSIDAVRKLVGTVS